MSTPAAKPLKSSDLSREEVAAEAYKLSVARSQRGAPQDAIGDWFEAEAIVRARKEEKRKEHADAAARVMTAPLPEEARTITAAGKAAAKKAAAKKAAAKKAAEAAAKAKQKPASKPAAKPAPTKSKSKSSGKKR